MREKGNKLLVYAVEVGDTPLLAKISCRSDVFVIKSRIEEKRISLGFVGAKPEADIKGGGRFQAKLKN